jgi:transcriptional regulator with XRE-family HTH domain
MPNILGAMLNLVTIGERVAEKRKSLKWTQLKLAQKAQVSRATLDALENGRLGELGFSKLSKILAALGFELELEQAKHPRPTLEELREENDDERGQDRRS